MQLCRPPVLRQWENQRMMSSLGQAVEFCGMFGLVVQLSISCRLVTSAKQNM